MNTEQGFTFFLQERDTIERLAKRMVRHRPSRIQPQLIEVALDEALRVSMMAVDTYDESKGASLKTHAMNRIRGAILTVLRTDTVVSGGERLSESNEQSSIDRDQVSAIIAKLSPQQALMLHLRYVEQLTLRDIAARINRSVPVAASRVKDALNAAREAAGG